MPTSVSYGALRKDVEYTITVAPPLGLPMAVHVWLTQLSGDGTRPISRNLSGPSDISMFRTVPHNVVTEWLGFVTDDD